MMISLINIGDLFVFREDLIDWEAERPVQTKISEEYFKIYYKGEWKDTLRNSTFPNFNIKEIKVK